MGPSGCARLGADVAVVAAFGQILPRRCSTRPVAARSTSTARCCRAIAAPAPIQWAIMRGETVTGITTFQMDAGMDTGPTLLSASTAIGSEESAGDLAVRSLRSAPTC
jgi:methionyl-tRNA formyltransferase